MSYINGRSVIAIGILFPTLGAAAVTARFYVRRNRKVSLGVDDWLCLPALVGYIFKERCHNLLVKIDALSQTLMTGCAASLIVGK